MFCGNCGNKLDDDDKFCGNCGEKAADVQSLSNETRPLYSSPDDGRSSDAELLSPTEDRAASESSSATEGWYYVLNNESCGPFSENIMRELVKNGTLSPDSLVWNSALDSIRHDWFPVKETILASPVLVPSSQFPAPFKKKDSKEIIERLLYEGKMASRVRRFWADTIDNIGRFLYVILTVTIDPGRRNLNLKPADFVLNFILFFNIIYFLLCIRFLYLNGQTVGKKILGIRVANLDGSTPSLLRIFLHRNSVLWAVSVCYAILAKVSSHLYSSLTSNLVLTLVLNLIYLGSKCRMLKKDHRTLDDIIAQTVVLKAR